MKDRLINDLITIFSHFIMKEDGEKIQGVGIRNYG